MANEFFASKYINGVELEEAIRRKEAGEAEILPVLIEETPAFENHPALKKLQATPSVKGKLKPLNKFSPRVSGWRKVETALREMIAEFAQRKR